MEDLLTKDVYDVARALCNLEHDDPCRLPDCSCKAHMKSEYLREATQAVGTLRAIDADRSQDEHLNVMTSIVERGIKGQPHLSELPSPWVMINADRYVLYGTAFLPAIELRRSNLGWHYKITGQPKAGNLGQPMELKACAELAVQDLLQIWRAGVARIERVTTNGTG